MAKTQSEILVAGLLASGYVEATSASRKARKFVLESTGATYWVGKAGSLRIGRVYTASHPSGAKDAILAKGRKALGVDIMGKPVRVTLSDADRAQVANEAQDRGQAHV